jgi:asparagine synthase (glutamine-hydrolysing)
MCGIAGFVDISRQSNHEMLARTVEAMTDAIAHRGPDGHGKWIDEAAGVALGHRRLAIVDLSPAGHQPMISASGRLVIAYNGELYNSEELRRELGGRVGAWRGYSDTEVLLEAVETWGPVHAMGRSLGMFALALWDRQDKCLWLIRDRLGKKPLYWTLQGQTFLFGSELRALRAHPGFAPDVDRDSVAGFVRRGYFLHPRTVYRGVQQLEPGHMLRVDAEGQVKCFPYWSLIDAISAAKIEPFTGDLLAATDALDDLLRDAVRRRLVSDVPLGAFLSGGVDSSTVVAIMQQVTSAPVRTFSIGFSEPDYNEAPQAKAVASYLGTDHTELVVTPAEAQDLIPRLPEIYDEPFADSSQVPTFLVSRMAKSRVTVALTGDGGDELFAGYNRYAMGATVLARFGAFPGAAQKTLAALLHAVPPDQWDQLFRLLPPSRRPRTPGEKLHKLANVLGKDTRAAYLGLTSPWGDPEGVVIGGREAVWPVEDANRDALLSDRIEFMQYLDTVSYLPGDILTKVDRATMAVGLEARNPLLDHRVLSFAWSLPLDFKVCGGDAKRALRQVLYRYVPSALVDRPKSGFGIPIGTWLRGPLRDWAEDLLDERKLKEAGLLNPGPIRARWHEHLTGRRNWQHALWTILMFEAWRARWASG